MTTDRWETLSAWFNDWLSADAPHRARLHAEFALQHPDLIAEADALVGVSAASQAMLQTPALLLAAQTLATDDTLLSPGAMVGPYRVVDLLARGGMGDVYRARDTRLERDVALKVLAPTRTADPGRLERFLHEARVTAALDHPNIVRVYDVGPFEDRAFLVAELLEGETLRARIARGPVTADEARRIGADVARGLAAAHAAGVVHRDLKPENIFLTRAGTTKLLDFGIAKLAQDETVRDGYSTLTGVVLGTAGYLAPEQIRGETVDPRADLFAFGAVLFEILTGTRAFARDHLVETLYAILHDEPDHGLLDRPGVSPALADMVGRLLAKPVEARPRSAADVLEALEGMDRAATVGPLRRFGHRARRAWATRRVTLRRAALGLLCAAAASIYYASRPAEVTLAVMPFDVVPVAGDASMLELGLPAAFVGRLGRLSDVRVLPMTATERLRGKDPLDAGRQLGATHVLTMRLQQADRELRATPQLTSTAEGSVIWTDNFPADASNVFRLQDLIVTQVAAQLAPRLSEAARANLADAGTRNNEAYQAFLRGQARVFWPEPRDLLRASEFFQEAVRLDPAYADAWAGLGSAYKRMPPVLSVPSGMAFPKAKEAADRALAIDPEHAEAHSVLGTVAFWSEWDYPRAERLLRRAIELQPNSADAHLFLAHLFSNIGRHDEALAEIRRARDLDRDWPLPWSLEGEFLFHARRYEEANGELDALLAAAPRFWNGQLFRIFTLTARGRLDDALKRSDDLTALSRAMSGDDRPNPYVVSARGFVLARMGRREEATASLDALRRDADTRYVSPYHEALVLHGLGRDDEAVERLEAAVGHRDFLITFLGVTFFWDDLRATPGFRSVLRSANLLDVSDRVRR